MTSTELIRKMAPFFSRGGFVILRNSEGTMELKGPDLAVKDSDAWITIYHETASGSERASHLHLRKGACRHARVVEREGGTTQIGFWPAREDARDEGKPPLALYFPPFYDWDRDKAPIAEHQELCRQWVEENGSEFDLEG